MISSLLHFVCKRPRVYYTLTNFKGGGGQDPLAPPPQYANDTCLRTDGSDRHEWLNDADAGCAPFSLPFEVKGVLYAWGYISQQTLPCTPPSRTAEGGLILFRIDV